MGGLSIAHIVILLLVVVTPIGLSWFIGPRYTLLVFSSLGLVIGYLKADQPWHGDGAVANAFLIIGQGFGGLIWAGVAIGIVALIKIARRRGSPPQISN